MGNLLRSLTASLLILILALGPSWAAGPDILPAGVYVKSGQAQLRAYTLDEFKVILHIYADYRSWYDQIPRINDQLGKLNELAQNQSKQLELRAQEAKMLQGERERLTKKWEEENKLRHLCEEKPAFGNWIAWGSAGAMTLVATVLTVILIVKE